MSRHYVFGQCFISVNSQGNHHDHRNKVHRVGLIRAFFLKAGAEPKTKLMRVVGLN